MPHSARTHATQLGSCTVCSQLPSADTDSSLTGRLDRVTMLCQQHGHDSEMDSSAVDGDVARGRTRPQREVRLTGLGLGGRLQSDPDVARHRVEVEPGGQIVGHPDRQGA